MSRPGAAGLFGVQKPRGLKLLPVLSSTTATPVKPEKPATKAPASDGGFSTHRSSPRTGGLPRPPAPGALPESGVQEQFYEGANIIRAAFKFQVQAASQSKPGTPGSDRELTLPQPDPGVAAALAAGAAQTGERLESLNKMQNGMFESELKYLKSKISACKKHNSDLESLAAKHAFELEKVDQEGVVSAQTTKVLQSKLAALKAQVEALYAQNKAYQERVQHAQDCFTALRSAHQAMGESSKTNATLTEQVRTELTTVNEQVVELQQQVARVQQENAQLAKRVKQAHAAEAHARSTGTRTDQPLQATLAADLPDDVNVDTLEQAFSEVAMLRNKMANLQSTQEEDEKDMELRAQIAEWRKCETVLQQRLGELQAPAHQDAAPEELAGVKAMYKLVASDVSGPSMRQVGVVSRARESRRWRSRIRHSMLRHSESRPHRVAALAVAACAAVRPPEPSEYSDEDDEEEGLDLRDLKNFLAQYGEIRQKDTRQIGQRGKARARVAARIARKNALALRHVVDMRVGEEDRNHRIFSLETEIKEYSNKISKTEPEFAWLATVHNFFLSQASNLQLQIEADQNDVERVNLLMEGLGKISEGKERDQHYTQEVVPSVVEMLKRKSEDNLARLSQLEIGMAANAGEEAAGAWDIPRSKPPGIPYTVQLAGVQTSDIAAQTVPAGFMSCKEIQAGTYQSTSGTEMQVTVFLVKLGDILIRVDIPELPAPLYHYTLLKHINFAPGQEPFVPLTARELDAEDSKLRLVGMGSAVAGLADLDNHRGGWPTVCLTIQESEREEPTMLLDTIDEECLQADEMVLSGVMTIEPLGLLFARAFTCRGADASAFGGTVHMELYHPESGWRKWCSTKVSRLMRISQSANIQALWRAEPAGVIAPEIQGVFQSLFKREYELLEPSTPPGDVVVSLDEYITGDGPFVQAKVDTDGNIDLICDFSFLMPSLRPDSSAWP